jgi:N-acetylneuraminate synthase
VKLGNDLPTYFIADIAANHDGSLDRALMLIELAAGAGADAAKFQNFRAETIVSQKGFDEIGRKLTHQASWEKSVFEVYKDAEVPLEWTEKLVQKCNEVDIDYFTAPYDLSFIDFFADKMPFFKVGSGDITWKESLQRMCRHKKPIMLATGASTMAEVRAAVELIEESGNPYVLMQCNTNYTGEINNLQYLNVRVLEEYRREFPKAILGLSDHSPGHISVLAAVSLGARAIEKHFTDDVKRIGPDHAFSLDPISWQKMVDNTRVLEMCLGDGIKKIETNEIEARIVQRRAMRYRRDLKAGTSVLESDLIALRPAPPSGISPFQIENFIGKVILQDVAKDQIVGIADFEA